MIRNTNSAPFWAAAVMLLPLACCCVDKSAPPILSPPATNPAAAVPTARVFEDVDQFRRIAIVSDVSGSMINKMASLKIEMGKTVEGLLPEQAFNLIFMGCGRPNQMSRELVPASPENKRKAVEFLEGVTTCGTTEPISAMEAAVKEKPDVIYLLTDGDFPDNAELLQRIRELNKDQKIRIYTIAFTGKLDSDTAYIDLLKQIAKENRGRFKRVNEEELP